MQQKVVIVFIFISVFLSCKPAYEITKNEQTEYILSDTSNNGIDSAFYNMIEPYRKVKDSIMSAVIAESDFALERGVPEGKLGDYVSDACLAEAKEIYRPQDNHTADFAFFNNGGLRRALPAGKITRGDVYELMPFENALVIILLDGKSVEKIFNFIASKGGQPVSGVRFEIMNSEAKNIFIGGEPIDTAKSYKVLTSDYLANGGDSYSFLADKPYENLNLKVRDALLRNLTALTSAGKKLSVVTDGRITNAK